MLVNLYESSVLDSYKKKFFQFLNNYDKVIVNYDNKYSKIIFTNKNNSSDILGEIYVSNSKKESFLDTGFCTAFTFKLFCEYIEKIYILKMKITDFEKNTKNLPVINYSNILSILIKVFGNLNNLIKSLLNVDKFNKVKLSGDIIDTERSQYGTCYVWKMKIEYGGKQYTFKYTNSVNNGNSKPSLKDCIYSLLCDRNAFLSCRDLEDFFFNYCSDDMTAGEVNRMYLACERTSNALERIFGNDLEWFEKSLENY